MASRDKDDWTTSRGASYMQGGRVKANAKGLLPDETQSLPPELLLPIDGSRHEPK
jgi:hypothetical protein